MSREHPSSPTPFIFDKIRKTKKPYKNLSPISFSFPFFITECANNMNKNLKHVIFSHCCNSRMCLHRGADTSLARPGRKQTTETEDFDFHIYPVYNHNWRNISTIYIYNTTNIKRNILP